MNWTTEGVWGDSNTPDYKKSFVPVMGRRKSPPVDYSPALSFGHIGKAKAYWDADTPEGTRIHAFLEIGDKKFKVTQSGGPVYGVEPLNEGAALYTRQVLTSILSELDPLLTPTLYAFMLRLYIGWFAYWLESEIHKAEFRALEGRALSWS